VQVGHPSGSYLKAYPLYYLAGKCIVLSRLEIHNETWVKTQPRGDLGEGPAFDSASQDKKE